MSARIVVVEDEAPVRLFVARTLASRGYRVAAFKTVSEASEVVRGGDFELLLVDVELPDGFGLDLISLLPSESRVPTIVMSGMNGERDFARGFAAGAADYMGKPFTADELLARVARVIGRKTERQSRPDATKEALTFGRYKLEKRIGRGSYGVVALARDFARSGERVALKVLSPQYDDEGDDAKVRFIRETVALARLNDPGVVRILDIGGSDGRIYYSMEYVPGPTLQDHVTEHGPLSERQARLLAGGLLRALAAVHGAGLVHRDLKPANVILRDGDLSQPVLIDFGLAKTVGQARLTRTGLTLGTPAYMAPEVIMGRDADARSDLFSLGLTIRYALTGSDVFTTETISQLMLAMTRGPITVPEVALSDPFAVLLDWLFAMDPASRPPTALAALRATLAMGTEATPRACLDVTDAQQDQALSA